MTTQESLRQEFYKTFTRSFPGDSGIGGNDPQEPVWEIADDPKEVADWWISRINTLLTELETDLEGSKQVLNPNKVLGSRAIDEAVGYNLALSDVLKIISNLKQR